MRKYSTPTRRVTGRRNSLHLIGAMIVISSAAQVSALVRAARCWVCGFLHDFRTGRHGELSRWIHHRPGPPATSKNTERSTADSRSVTHDSDHTAHQHTRVRTENRAACPRASPQTTSTSKDESRLPSTGQLASYEAYEDSTSQHPCCC